MDQIVLLAAKSILIAGAVLILLRIMRRRSASERSWIAHIGLAAIMVLPLALLLPQIHLPAPSFMEQAVPVGANTAVLPTVTAQEPAPIASTFPATTAKAAAPASSIDWAFWAYAVPAGLLLLLTLTALLRLVVLKAKANVLVEPSWLSALAHAQRRMGFKYGTALLTSDELSSPISWGLVRPVILLNSEAANAKGEAEAIIAHELAHVARLDWAKLMLSRVTVAIFWFNPLVWLLAREAHQLREEAADDAVLAADIDDTEYANLLVGIARHECRGLLLGAHGVAPGKASLTRRVKRVLDAALDRAPGGWKWSSAAAFFAAGMTVPVAALQFVSPTIAEAKEQGRFGDARVAVVTPQAAPASPAAVAPPAAEATTVLQAEAGEAVIENSRLTAENDRALANVGPAVQSAVAAANGAVAHAQASIDRAIALKAMGASPAYARSLRNAAPNLRLTHDDIMALAAMGVSAQYVRDLANSGYRGLDADTIVEARALGITGAYIRGMAAAGYPNLSLDDLQGLKAMGITPSDVARYRRANRGLPSVDALIAAKATGVAPEDIDPHDGE